MGGIKSVVSMGYAVLFVILLYLVGIGISSLIQYIKKKIYHIAFSSSRRKYHTPTHFYFSLGKQKFLRGHAEKKSWADSKKQISYKTTIKQRQKKLSFKKKNCHHIAK